MDWSDRLAQAAEDAHSYIQEQKMSDAQALAKAAMDHRLNPEHIRLLVQAFNIGRVNALRLTSGHVLEKTAEVPLVDYKDVMRQIYPKTTPPLPDQFPSLTVQSRHRSEPSQPRVFVNRPKVVMKVAAFDGRNKK